MADTHSLFFGDQDGLKTPWQILGFALLVLLLMGASALIENNVNPYVQRIIVNCGIGIILGLSLNLVNGCAGQFSLGHAGFMAVGAYVSAYLTTVLMPFGAFFQSDLGVGTAVVAGGLAAGLSGYVVGLPSLRLRGDYLAIVTLGFGEIIRIVFLNISAVGGPRGLPGIPLASNFFWVYLWAIVTFAIIYRLIHSSAGRAILSIREDEISSQSMGVDVSHYKVVAFVISAFFAGVAGGLFAHYQGFIDPNTFNFNRSVEVVIMVVIGGMGSLSGAVIGAVLVTMLPELLRFFAEYRMVIFSGLLVLVMLLRPMGIFGRHEIWEASWFANLKRKPKP
ncbi:MAG: branched-chain amino acid ABC transporter permease [Bdellovibrionales bacterium]|nr:branched-chain amino acid ABC transporter permease [Bdellovibrionales bacterium]